MHIGHRAFAAALITLSLLAAGIRISGALLNRDANDNHLKVIRIIALEHRIPDKEEPECLQCYHPKLYHASAAALGRLLPRQDDKVLLITAQLLSALAGIATLAYILSFLLALRLAPSTTLITFALTALNPALIGIHIQSTNDAFVILFGTAALFHGYRFLCFHTLSNAALTALAITLAALSKGSGIIFLIGFALIGLFGLIRSWREGRLSYAWLLLILSLFLATIAAITIFGPYDEYAQRYGSALVINKEKSPPPHFFDQTSVGSKTGIVSVYDGYLTFRPWDLVHEPYLDREREADDYQSARVSLWTQLYARANFIHYEGHPSKWFVRHDDPVYLLGSVSYVLALLPLTLLLVGLILTLKRIFAKITKNLTDFATHPEWILLFFLSAFLAFLIKFTMEYREFSSMKPIYIFPALLSIVCLLANGTEYVVRHFRQPWVRNAMVSIAAALTMLYVIDMLWLYQKF